MAMTIDDGFALQITRPISMLGCCRTESQSSDSPKLSAVSSSQSSTSDKKPDSFDALQLKNDPMESLNSTDESSNATPMSGSSDLKRQSLDDATDNVKCEPLTPANNIDKNSITHTKVDDVNVKEDDDHDLIENDDGRQLAQYWNYQWPKVELSQHWLRYLALWVHMIHNLSIRISAGS